MALDENLGFLGFGNMGSAIARGLIARQTLPGARLHVYDVDPAKRAEAQAMGAQIAADPESLARHSTTLVLAVKPQTMAEALGQIPKAALAGRRVVSIAAGVSIAALHTWLGNEVRVIRVMPNTPAMVGAGAAGIALGPTCEGSDADVACAIFEAVGSVEVVDEQALDLVTALSGSGPAYFFYVVECLVRAAVEEGMPEDQAMRLASQTMYGAAKLLIESGDSPGMLRERVTSKGGTTAAALAAFQEHGLAAVLARGVKAAAARSRELGQGQ